MSTIMELYSERRTDSGWELVRNLDDRKGAWDWGQNYFLYAVLGNVRNYDHSVRPGEPSFGDAVFAPIAKSRGIPEDLSPQIQEILADDHVGHDPSWLLASEILNYDWESSTTLPLRVSPAAFLELLEPGKFPGQFSQGGDPAITPEEMEKWIEEIGVEKARLCKGLYTRDSPSPLPKGMRTPRAKVDVSRTCREWTDDFPKELNKIVELANEAPINVRLVFWFYS